MAGDGMKITPTPALRVSQLDAAELDGEVISLMKLQLSKLFKYHQTNILVSYEPEVNALLKFIVWKPLIYQWFDLKSVSDVRYHKFTVSLNESTIGQDILNLKYFSGKTFKLISRRQKYVYALILIGCPWLRDRSPEILKFFGLISWKDQSQKILRWIEVTFKLANLINFLVFLQQGVYHSITERILGIRPMFPNKHGVRQVSFEYMTRELMWHGFSEFLFFILPLINFQRIKNFLQKTFLPRKKGMVDQSKRELTNCAICGEWPVNPQEIGCQHVYCYFCIKSNYKADPSYSCPLCDMNIPSEDAIKTFKFTIPPR